ncbi:MULTISPECIES: ABC transporter permease [Prauserella salsuginis group]|uniref:Simple sugar transport system permease protein n=2 Tax=Prauserella salsuginis group TaxID=2893672 RepID=A0A839XHP4_9PSEU|nr:MULTISPECIES: ABC transporter permease [Prauserella salsuginis group]MBB3661997.1 simple sugar transport system permease protein [Prauserella sediminis]MCR3719696.1 simple sugar transport system permease protein [Prauserella flava]MCR3736761.1 simple sugar transport system permease protein [Prauserella salsuginis]
MINWRTALLPPALAIIFAMLLSSVALLISGANPLEAFATMGAQLFHGNTAVSTVNLAIVYYLAGLAAAIGFQMNVFNIGVEGQYRFAAVVAAIVGAWMELPPVLHVIAILVVAMFSGALYALLPALLKVYRGVSEVITTIMLNSIVFGIVAFLINPEQFGVLHGNNLSTAEIAPSGRIPGIPLGEAGTLFGFIVIAGALGYGYWFMLTRTRFGFELKASGESKTAAAAGGVSARKMTLAAMLLSGAVAGLVAMPELLGRDYVYAMTATQGYGFTGLAVALLGRNHPAGIAFGALLWAFLDRSAVSLESIGIPSEIATIMQGTIVLSVVVAYEIVRRADLAAEQRRVGRAGRNGQPAGVAEGGAV